MTHLHVQPAPFQDYSLLQGSSATASTSPPVFLTQVDSAYDMLHAHKTHHPVQTESVRHDYSLTDPTAKLHPVQSLCIWATALSKAVLHAYLLLHDKAQQTTQVVLITMLEAAASQRHACQPQVSMHHPVNLI